MDWTQCLTIIGSFAGLIFFINKNHREDIQNMDAKWKTSDQRWAALFEKFHILDKDVEKFRLKDRD